MYLLHFAISIQPEFDIVVTIDRDVQEHETVGGFDGKDLLILFFFNLHPGPVGMDFRNCSFIPLLSVDHLVGWFLMMCLDNSVIRRRNDQSREGRKKIRIRKEAFGLLTYD